MNTLVERLRVPCNKADLSQTDIAESLDALPSVVNGTLVERLRASRKEVGLSQADVAKSLNVSPSAVNQWEQGLSKNIKLEHFFVLAQLLHQDPQWLATGTVFPQQRRTQEAPPLQQSPPLSREEKALLHQFGLLPDKLRKHLLKFIKELSDLPVSG